MSYNHLRAKIARASIYRRSHVQTAPRHTHRQAGGGRCRADAASDVHADGFRKALKAGVKMALSSDIRPLKEAGVLCGNCSWS